MTSGLQAVLKETELPLTDGICMCNTGSKDSYCLPPQLALSVQLWIHDSIYQLYGHGEGFLQSSRDEEVWLRLQKELEMESDQ